MVRTIFIFVIYLIGCGGPVTEIAPALQSKNYPNLFDKYVSCSGRGKIDLYGPISGSMSFLYMSQRDSSFFQFKDPLGRKVVLMWITPHSVSARNLIENKQYKYDKILEFFPFLQIVEPNDITKFLWGIQPDYLEKLNYVDRSDSVNIVLEFDYGHLETENHELVKVKFHDGNSNQTVTIKIKKRIRDQSHIDMNKLWNFQHS